MNCPETDKPFDINDITPAMDECQEQEAREAIVEAMGLTPSVPMDESRVKTQVAAIEMQGDPVSHSELAEKIAVQGLK